MDNINESVSKTINIAINTVIEKYGESCIFSGWRTEKGDCECDFYTSYATVGNNTIKIRISKKAESSFALITDESHLIYITDGEKVVEII